MYFLNSKTHLRINDLKGEKKSARRRWSSRRREVSSARSSSTVLPVSSPPSTPRLGDTRSGGQVLTGPELQEVHNKIAGDNVSIT
ncbi:hypothetical protein FKM82_023496 [Ascaphus truei]